MANTNSPFGLRPIRHLTGGEVRLQEYSIAAAYSTKIHQGDPVEMTGTGRNIQIAAAGNVDNIGVFWGCRYVDAGGEQQFGRYWPGTAGATDIVAMVYDDPKIVYECQSDTLAEGDVGTLVDWNEGTASDSTGVSGAYAVGSVTGTTGKALRVQRLVPRVDNAYGAYAKVEVTFAEHAQNTSVSGVGGI